MYAIQSYYDIDSANTAALGGSGDLPNTDPLLGPLQYNGGTLKTMALLAGSPAIDAGNDGAAPATDQRGFSRNSTSDIGAYEFNAVSRITSYNVCYTKLLR